MNVDRMRELAAQVVTSSIGSGTRCLLCRWKPGREALGVILDEMLAKNRRITYPTITEFLMAATGRRLDKSTVMRHLTGKHDPRWQQIKDAIG